jgi:hypothetical protein
MKAYVYLEYYLAEFFFEWDMFRTEVLEREKKTRFMFSKFFSLENRSVYKVRYKNIVEPGRPERTMS